MNTVSLDVESKSEYASSFAVNSEGNYREVMAGLNSFQKILLITNGTVTDLLEHYL